MLTKGEDQWVKALREALFEIIRVGSIVGSKLEDLTTQKVRRRRVYIGVMLRVAVGLRGALPSLSKSGLEWHLMKETDDAGLGVSQKSIVRASSQCIIRVQGRTLLPRVANRI